MKYFQNLFSHKQGIYDLVMILLERKIKLEDNTLLIRPFTEEEFYNIVTGMNGDKLLGPDGLDLAFYNKFWGVCGRDMYKSCYEGLDTGSIPAPLNGTNIALILKCENPRSM